MTLLLFVRTEDRLLCHADEAHNLRAKQLSSCQLGDMAVRMREVRARPWVSVCVPLALF